MPVSENNKKITATTVEFFFSAYSTSRNFIVTFITLSQSHRLLTVISVLIKVFLSLILLPVKIPDRIKNIKLLNFNNLTIDAILR